MFRLPSIFNASPTPSAPRVPEAAGAAQFQRFELKYLIGEEIARSMRPFVRCHLVSDTFAQGSADCAYAVHTLYLDSPALALYAATENGDRNRFKLRVRFYDDRPDAPAFFEIKGRSNEAIIKRRAAVRGDAVEPLLRGEWPTLGHLVKPEAKQWLALQEFCRRMRMLNATPRSHVAYRREAWVSRADNSLRVTFDRAVRCEPHFSARLHASAGEGQGIAPFDSRVICEIKFTTRWPSWCGEMVRAFGLVRGGAAKYAEGVAQLGEHHFSDRGIGLRPVAGLPALEPELLMQGHTAHPC